MWLSTEEWMPVEKLVVNVKGYHGRSFRAFVSNGRWRNAANETNYLKCVTEFEVEEMDQAVRTAKHDRTPEKTRCEMVQPKILYEQKRGAGGKATEKSLGYMRLLKRIYPKDSGVYRFAEKQILKIMEVRRLAFEAELEKEKRKIAKKAGID